MENQLSFSDFGIQIDELPHLPSAKKGTAGSLRIRYKTFGSLTMADVELFSSLPEHPFWSEVERHIDFSFADELCAHLYSPNGQRPFAPSLKLKVHFVQAFYQLSDREIEERMIYDIAIKQFLGVPMAFKGFDHSTIALDRNRLGDRLFHACFHYILAQARQHKLWGSKEDRWLIDSFPSYANLAKVGVYRLILQGVLRVVQQLKRSNAPLFGLAQRMLRFEEWFQQRLSIHMTKEEFAVAFSKLVSRAYSLLYWFENDSVRPLFWNWDDKKRQLDALELQALLLEILQDNTRPSAPTPPPSEGLKTEQPSLTSPITASEPLEFERIPRKDRPKNRIVSILDPDARYGAKSNSKKFVGSKIQVVKSAGSPLILEIEPIPGNEHDGERMESLIHSIIRYHGVKPAQIVGDTAYGSIDNREKLDKLGVPVCAPLMPNNNCTGLLSSEAFTYDPDALKVTCPQGHSTTHKVRNNKGKGHQYKFPKAVCASCPLFATCTKPNNGRTIFISDHYEMQVQVRSYNESNEGQEAFQIRKTIERSNNELKNHLGLGHPKTRGNQKLRISSKMAGMVINVKWTVQARREEKYTPFFRVKSRLRRAAACG
jgi:hypothetical protein